MENGGQNFIFSRGKKHIPLALLYSNKQPEFQPEYIKRRFTAHKI